MSQDSPSLHYKDQVAPVPAERRRSPPNRDPDGKLLAAEDGTHFAAKSHKMSTARQAKTVDSPRDNYDNVRAPPSADADATATLMAFDVVAVDDSTTGNNINDNDIVPNITNINDDSNETGAPSQSKHDHPQKSFPWNTAIVAMAVVVIVIVGIVVGGVCGSGGCGGTSADAARETSPPVEAGNGENPSPPTTMAPTTLSPVEAGNGNNTTPPTTMAPTTPSPVKSPSPTQPPITMAPTTRSPVKTLPPTSTRSQDITNFINSKSYMGVDLSPNGTSPEERALQWLINDDPLQLNVGAEVDEFRLLQRYSLLTLWFQASTGTTWTNSTHWLNADECTWFGITCQSGVATRVDFSSSGFTLQGSLSPDLGLLTDLTRFDTINYNSVSGSLPSEFGLWTNLELFDVGGNALTGSLPSEIGLWTNLEVFSVRDNALAGTIPATIANWKLIENAWFDTNNFSGSMPNGICEFITGGDRLSADCDEVTCSCCTYCH